MQIPSTPHSWSVTPRQAVAIQKKLASAVVRQRTGARSMRFVAGLDAAFSPDGAHCFGGVVLWDMEEQVVVEKHLARRRLVFPYIPGLLTFREAPAILAVLRKTAAHAGRAHVRRPEHCPSPSPYCRSSGPGYRFACHRLRQKPLDRPP